ncbi:MAG: hypothetical protein ACJ8BW_02160 [Ktedonobacteraceae bacterium]
MQETFVLDEEKSRGAHAEMFHGVPDAIFVLSGGVKKVVQLSDESEDLVAIDEDYPEVAGATLQMP